MTHHAAHHEVTPAQLAAAVEYAARAIPPLWPLASSVAVNPFLGQAGDTLAQTAARLARVGGISVAMPRHWYDAQISAGSITDQDLEAALAARQTRTGPADVAALKAAANKAIPVQKAFPTVADFASKASGIDWTGLIAERFGTWAAGYFDEGQALWAAPRGRSAYAAWRAVATHDLTPEIAGLTGFAAHVADCPETAEEALARCVNRLGLQAKALDTYFHQLLVTLGGYGQFARYKLWQAELGGTTDHTIRDLLVIRLIWEEALLIRHDSEISREWAAICHAHAGPVTPSPDQIADTLLQEAAERAAQRGLAGMLAKEQPAISDGRPVLQAAFCIDVRSEVFRRALEAASPDVQTLGFAGFFGLGAGHRRFASDVRELRLPVLLNPGVFTCSGTSENSEQDLSSRYSARARRAWGRFKLAAVSSFAFVEATGPIYAAKLVGDGLGLTSTQLPHDPAPRFEPALSLAARINAAETVLRAMSLTGPFARLVLLTGHGANVVNNPHASGLHCGACGGYSGEVNARLLAGLLNDPKVRNGLVQKGLHLPHDTLFLGALHDTTTDAVLIYDSDHPSSSHADDLTQAKRWLKAAGQLARTERALRLPRAENGSQIPQRSRDWAEIRPEWALAGCKAFIAAPRRRTAGKNLKGRAFLHDYDWSKDSGFAILELIMTAPVVVASWISLQYYGSVVAPDAFGSGNKLLHNVSGGIGVVEGNGGTLRAGLSWQSVHDGDKLAHEPLRLSVCIEAPREAMSDILRRHDGVKALFDNRWMHLFALDEAGHMAWRYAGNLEWEPMERGHAAAVRTSAAESLGATA